MRRTIAAFGLLLLLVGCDVPQSSMRPGGPAGSNLAQIGWVTYVLFGVISFIMWGLLLWACIRRRGSLAEHERWDVGGGHSWIWIGGFAIPFVVLCGMFVFAMERMTQFPLADHHNVTPEIQVIGHQWWWEVHYLAGGVSNHFITANEIHIPTGRAVDIELETADVIHSFWIPALHGKVELIPGQPNFIRIQATKAVNYEGECGEYCGEQHAHMRLLVVAQSADEYAAWRAQQLKPASDPQTMEAMHGRDLFNQAACALCHTIRGTVAQGKVAPDLTHLAGRQFIAANTYANNTANLEAWVVHAQSLKPGAEMPNLSEFNGSDLRALVAYLQELK